MIEEGIKPLIGCSVYPAYKAKALREECLMDGSWSKAVGIRALFVAQIVVTAAALPLSLLAMFLAPAISLFTEGREKAGKLFVLLAQAKIIHLSLIPTSIIAAFAPHSAEWFSPAKSVAVFFDFS